MQPPRTNSPIVVGIDGSQAAIDAALWAADEALSRDLTLRLVHVVDVEADLDPDEEDPTVVCPDQPETERGIEVLQAASAAVRKTGKPLNIETQILWGEVDSTLLKESQRAAMTCVGSVGIAPVCHRMLGSTAATLADHAYSPVAVIRTARPSSPSESDWIIAVIDDSPDIDEVVEQAFAEAHLRRAPVLALGVSHGDHRAVHYDDLERRVIRWRHDHPDVHVYPVSGPTDATTFLAQHDDLSVLLTILSAASSEQTPALVGPHRPSRSAHSRCSVLVVR